MDLTKQLAITMVDTAIDVFFMRGGFDSRHAFFAEKMAFDFCLYLRTRQARVRYYVKEAKN